MPMRAETTATDVTFESPFRTDRETIVGSTGDTNTIADTVEAASWDLLAADGAASGLASTIVQRAGLFPGSLTPSIATALGSTYEAHAAGGCACSACASEGGASAAPPPGTNWSDFAADSPPVVETTAFGNDYVDGILYGTKWSGPLTYSFADSVADFGPSYPYTIGGFAEITETQKTAFRAILEGVSIGGTFAYGSFSDVANIDITLAADPSGPSDLVIGEADTLGGQNIPTARVVDFPELDQRISGGDLLFGNDNNVYRNPTPGTFGWVTHIHELGHAFGLSHGHNSGGSTFGKTIPADRNAEEFSVMSYASIPNDFIKGSSNETFGMPQTLMQLDLIALQHLYGANYTTNAGTTIYRWSPTTGQMSINGVGQGLPGNGAADANKVFMTVWDGGGSDIYDLSNYSNDMQIDLTPGGWSRISDEQTAVRNITQQVVGAQPFEAHLASGNVYNAYMFNGDQRSLIEHAVGGSGSDWVEGNIADNKLRGNAGDDSLNGREGDDDIQGGSGNDLIFGDGREGGPAYNGPAYLQVPTNISNSTAQNAFDVTQYVGRQENPDVRDSATNPHVSLDVNGNNNGQDFFKIFVPGPGLLVLDIDYGTQNNFNAYMVLFDEAGTLLSASDESGVDSGSSFDLLANPNNPNSERGSEDPHIVYNVSNPGYFIIGVDDHIGRGVYSGVGYRLSITLPNYDETPSSAGDDLLSGDDGDDRMFGQGGDDVLMGDAGSDQLNGGGGSDTADYSNSSSAVTISLQTGNAQGGHATGDTLSSIENLVGSNFDDYLKGSTGTNRLEGGAGDDRLEGGAGTDRLYGSTGIDTAVYSGSSSAVTISLETGNAVGGHAAGDMLLSLIHI